MARASLTFRDCHTTLKALVAIHGLDKVPPGQDDITRGAIWDNITKDFERYTGKSMQLGMTVM